MTGRQGRNTVLVLLASIVVMAVLLRGQPLGQVWSLLKEAAPWLLPIGLLFMLVFVGCEALCTHLVLGQLGHKTTLGQCLTYSFLGFYVSAITPSSTGGQPAQVCAMGRDGIPVAHGTLDMLLLSICYQSVTVVYALVALLVLPELNGLLGVAGHLLLWSGVAVTTLLTCFMVAMLLCPQGVGRILTHFIQILAKWRIIKDENRTKSWAVNQVATYERGASCLGENAGLLPRLLGLTAVQMMALYGVPWLVYRSFGLNNATFLQLVALQALVSMAVGLLPIPGSVGASEGVSAVGYALFFGANLVAPAVMVCRAISFYGFLLFSAAVTLFAERYRLTRSVSVGYNGQKE